MSYPGYPPYQGSGSSAPNYPQQQHSAPYPPGAPYPPQSAPYPSQSAPYPPQGGVFPPSLGYAMSAPMYMPQPYDGAAASPYPPPAAAHPPPPSAQGGQYSSHGGGTHPPHGGYPVLPDHSHQSYGAPPTHQHHNTMLKHSPTVVPANPFNAREDAEILRKAMKGFGTDEKAIINVLARRTNVQRLEIAVQFKTLYGKDLIKDLKSELTGRFEDLVVALMTPLPVFYAKALHNAISGMGTDEDTLIEVMCTLSNHEIQTIRHAYQAEYHSNLESDLRGDTGGTFKRLMVSLCNAGRDESMTTNPHAAAADAQALLRAGELRLGTDESTFNMILCQRNYAQLNLIFQEYQRLTGHDIEKAIRNEFSGDAEDALLAIIRSIRNQPAFFAKRLHQSVAGMGTNDEQLIRIVVTRCEIDMGDIKKEYRAKYGESLADAIKGDCSGDYKKCLLALIGEN